MSAPRKRKERTSDSQSFDSVQDLILRIKAKLNHRADSQGAQAALVTELYELATLSERLINLRSNSSDLLDHRQSDILDREGTYLWNHSSSMRLLAGDQIPAVVAALRLAGFRLIEAGLPENLDVDCQPSVTMCCSLEIEWRAVRAGLVHMLQLASKTGATLADMGKSELASSVLTSAAKFEQSLRNADDHQNLHQQSIAQATVVYYCSRMEAAWKEGNDSVAQYMLRNITENNIERLAHLSARDRELLASKVLEIGRSLLTGSAQDGQRKVDTRAEEAVRWLQKAFSLAEHLDDTLTAGAAELKRCILRNLVRAYVLSSGLNPENLVRAETALDELLDSIPPDDQRDVANQELHWWKLAVLRRRNASEDTLFETFRSIIENMEFTEDNVTNILLDLRTSPHHQAHTDAIEVLVLESAEFELPKICATACLMLFYQYGEKKHSLKRCSDAVEWFLLGTRRAFSSVTDTCSSKCFRKAALCHIEQEEYAQASDIIRQCPGDEAATHYLSFLVAIKQGWENDGKDQLILLIITLSPPHGGFTLSYSGGQCSGSWFLFRPENATNGHAELLDHVRTRKATEMNVEPITLIRCMIRLVLRLIADPANAEGKDALIDTLIRHFATARALVDAVCKEKRVSLVIKDVSWLWRTAYNCATQGCTEWDNAEERVPPLFDMSRELLEIYLETALEVDEEMHLCIVYSSFAAASARVFAMRKLEPQMVNSEKLEFTAREIQTCEERLRKIVEKGVISSNNIPRVTQCLSILFIFQAELACRMNEWQVIPKVIEKVTQCQAPPCDTFEAITDMLAILHASLDRSALSVEKFARWLRAICTMLLARNTAPDRLKAIGYIEQAIIVLEEHGGDDVGDETYPIDERYWLLTSSYNTGIECLHVCLLDDARRWFEASSRMCKYVPDGAVRAKKITETYTHLMDRFGRLFLACGVILDLSLLLAPSYALLVHV
ncbi:hypothetical protein DFH94DRAFT_691907 [Russula ochroleuca]|uniref:Protein ZIP4 homolog n=1 Tax=Russula ochroleuca TaxID=152965 RepID=A0A9P5T9M9_9AGAM|nr:hypothetical protein DFH94DRAFT_691907 [Russula ochroleuca]